MDQFFQFVVNHWILWSAVVVLLLLIIQAEMGNQISGVGLVSHQEATLMLNRQEAVLVDLRDETQFKAGHIANAIPLPRSSLEKRINKLQKYKNKIIILYCETGKEASSSGSFLRKAGYEKVRVLKGGVQAWQAANLPLITS
jgi:rhodanese-related sulfurtransferase